MLLGILSWNPGRLKTDNSTMGYRSHISPALERNSVAMYPSYANQRNSSDIKCFEVGSWLAPELEPQLSVLRNKHVTIQTDSLRTCQKSFCKVIFLIDIWMFFRTKDSVQLDMHRTQNVTMWVCTCQDFCPWNVCICTRTYVLGTHLYLPGLGPWNLRVLTKT